MQASQELSGYHGKPRAAERWPEESGRGLDHNLFFVQNPAIVFFFIFFLFLYFLKKNN